MARLFITISFILSLCVLLFTTSSLAETDREWAQYQAQCQYKYPTINPAIDLLCSRNLHLPGVVASIGQNFDRTNKVAIVPNPQCLKDGRMNQNSNVWIPEYWCKRQFWKVCAQGNDRGRGQQIFGGRGCQQFYISDWGSSMPKIVIAN
ncbi:hypothetical protein D6C98_04619 [Aureobasidium pullulans]|nr:hypothetical protein D6C98_04619 [Aureobasidium pullulans]